MILDLRHVAAMEQSNHGYQTAKIHVAPQIHFRIVFFHYVTI